MLFTLSTCRLGTAWLGMTMLGLVWLDFVSLCLIQQDCSDDFANFHVLFLLLGSCSTYQTMPCLSADASDSLMCTHNYFQHELSCHLKSYHITHQFECRHRKSNQCQWWLYSWFRIRTEIQCSINEPFCGFYCLSLYSIIIQLNWFHWIGTTQFNNQMCVAVHHKCIIYSMLCTGIEVNLKKWKWATAFAFDVMMTNSWHWYDSLPTKYIKWTNNSNSKVRI